MCKFQIVEAKEIFDRTYWQVSGTHPAYWLAQLRKREWLRLMFLLSLKPVSSATKPFLASKVLERLEFQVCASRHDAYKAWQKNRETIIIQYRQYETDWTRSIPEILAPGEGDELGFSNISGRLVCRPRR
jgi:hypothetical protein